MNGVMQCRHGYGFYADCFEHGSPTSRRAFLHWPIREQAEAAWRTHRK